MNFENFIIKSLSIIIVGLIAKIIISPFKEIFNVFKKEPTYEEVNKQIEKHIEDQKEQIRNYEYNSIINNMMGNLVKITFIKFNEYNKNFKKLKNFDFKMEIASNILDKILKKNEQELLLFTRESSTTINNKLFIKLFYERIINIITNEIKKNFSTTS